MFSASNAWYVSFYQEARHPNSERKGADHTFSAGQADRQQKDLTA